MFKPSIQFGTVTKRLILLNLVVAFLYLGWWLWPGHAGANVLYWLLFFGEIYHVIMIVGFLYTIWPRKNVFLAPTTPSLNPSIAIFITVAGEPVSIVEKTARAAKNQAYDNHHVYLLNDGRAAKKDNWQEIEALAKTLGIYCITRLESTGAKAGNINNALRETKSDYIAILDADMVPHPDFLSTLLPYVNDPQVAFVQSPQYYKNFKYNTIASGAWEQQNFFFGPIMLGKNSLSSAFICGTNVIIKRNALEEVGGMYEKSIAEDFLTSLFIHQKKWKSVYIPEVLCEGLAPEDLLSYYKQQHRWARGSLEVLFGSNPLFKRGLSMGQRIQYLLSALYYCNGLIVLIDMAMPLIFLYFGIQAVSATTTSFAFFFIPYMFISLYTLFIISGRSLTFRAMSFSQSSFMLQLSALFSVILKRKTAFAVTAKQAKSGNYLSLIYPHLLYTFLALLGAIYGAYRHGLTPSVVTNSAWALFNIIMFIPFIRAGYSWNYTFPFFRKRLTDTSFILSS